jgi:hypothetical protein
MCLNFRFLSMLYFSLKFGRWKGDKQSGSTARDYFKFSTRATAPIIELSSM